MSTSSSTPSSTSYGDPSTEFSALLSPSISPSWLPWSIIFWYHGPHHLSSGHTELFCEHGDKLVHLVLFEVRQALGPACGQIFLMYIFRGVCFQS